MGTESDIEELADKISKMHKEEISLFLKVLAKKIKNSNSCNNDVNSEIFIAASYLGISSNWLIKS